MLVAGFNPGHARAPALRMQAAERPATWKPGEVAPTYLDGKLAGDGGFDPLAMVALARPLIMDKNVPSRAALKRAALNGPWSAEARRMELLKIPADEQKLCVYWMREAEVKHGRLAMLAAVGWPLAELINPWALGATGGRAPSLFNGGLNDAPVALFLLLASAGASYAEAGSADNVFRTWLKEPAEYVPGDVGFDPLRLFKEEGATRQRHYLDSEIKHGRLAMLAITGFAVQEFVWGEAVVDQTPWFFGN